MQNNRSRKSKTTESTYKNMVLGGAFWIVFIGGSCLWSDSLQEQHTQESIPTAYVESLGVQQARANMLHFKQVAPQQNFILAMIPMGGRHPKELTIYLSREWSGEPNLMQKQWIKQWNQVWERVATEGTSGE